MEHGNPFVSLLLITGLAVTVPLLTSRLRRFYIPIVVGEIVAGMVVGQSGLNLIEASEILDFLAEFGFAFLMFLSGLELNFDLLRPSAGRGGKGKLSDPVSTGSLMFLMTLGLAYLAALGVVRAGLASNAVMMALILSTTSLGVVLPVLKEKRLQDGPFGQYLLVAASIADFATFLLLAVVVAAIRGGLTLDLLLVLVLLIAFGLLARLGQYVIQFPLLRQVVRELSHATAQIKVRGAMALMVALVVLAEALGVEVILGAFLAGALISLLGGQQQTLLREKLDALGFGFFIPIFFIDVGVRFNLQALLGSGSALLLVPALLLALFLAKLVPAALLRRVFPWGESLAGGLLLSAQLSLIIAAAAIALELGVIDDTVNSAVILVAILSATMAPLLFNFVIGDRPLPKREGVLVFGDDPLAALVAQRLKAVGEPVRVVCCDPKALDRTKQMGLKVISVDRRDLRQGFEAAGARQVKAMVVADTDPNRVLEVARIGRGEYDIPVMVALVQDAALVEELRRQGVRTVQSALATALAIEGALRFPATFDLLVDTEDEVEVVEAVLENRSLAGMRVRDIRLPGDALLLNIRRDASLIIPHGDTRLELGDRLALIGSTEAVHQAVGVLESPG